MRRQSFRDRVPETPRSISVEEAGGGICRITRRWLQPTHLLVLLIVAVVLVLQGERSLAILRALSGGDDVSTRELRTLFTTAVCLAFSYPGIAGLLNRTVVELSYDSLSIRHGPLPWPGNRTLGRDELRQLYCREKITRGRYGERRTYQLWAVLPQFGRLNLLGGLPTSAEAQFLEAFLEDRLGVVDEPVSDEMPKS